MFPFSLEEVALISWYIGVLVFLEGLLSADNALVLALMVRHLPKREQKRVLRYGIWGAIGFRVVAVLLSTILLRFWYLKVAGGGYLLFLAIQHFVRREPGADAGQPGRDGSFWGTVIAVTLTDIAFSIDSILAAVAMAVGFPDKFGYNGKLFIVLTGGVLGIITMRLVVRYFVILLDRFPGLAEGAYLLVAWIGLKLVISGFHSAEYISFHIPEWLFWSVMLAIAVLSLLIRPPSRSPEMAASFELLEEEESSDGDDEQSDNGAIGRDHSDTEDAQADAVPERSSGQSA